jgi:hypothetical protein
MTHEDKRTQPPPRRDSRSSDFEKRGGYPSSAEPVAQLPRVRPGPGPGGKKPSEGSSPQDATKN